MKNMKILPYAFALIAFFAFTALNGCKEDGVHDPGIHTEAEGMIFRDASNDKYLQIFRGKIDTNFKEYFSAPLGSISDGFTVTLLDETQKEINPPTESEYTLTWEISDKSVVEVWQHDGEEGGFEFHLRGLKTGNATIEFKIQHGDHADFRTGSIPIVVEKSEDISFINAMELLDKTTNDSLAAITETQGGSLTISANAIGKPILAKFFDDKGMNIDLDSQKYILELKSGNNAVLDIVAPEEQEPFAFSLIGKQAGLATLTITIAKKLEEGETAPAKEFPAIAVKVE